MVGSTLVRRASRTPSPGRRVVLTLVGLAVCLSTVPAAHAAPLVQRALHRRHVLDHRLGVLRTQLAAHQRRTEAEIARMHREVERLASPLALGPTRWAVAHRHHRGAVFQARVRLMRYRRFVQRGMQRLQRERAGVTSWLATWGTFRRCPVAGPHSVADNFGITVRLPGVPVHRHLGNDIAAPSGTPIVAPFDGYASASSSPLGGLEVRVHGAAGYVYNAHLASYGRLGPVRMGDVIGYVGATGDATVSHDHFEWHPGDGPAVDPNPLLSVVC